MLTYKPGDKFAEHYQLVKLVDTGGFAEVWEGVFMGKTVALKIFPKLDEEGVNNIEEQYRSEADLLHTNLLIPRYYGVYEGHPFLEMRFCDGGNASQKIGSCNEAEIAKCLNQIAGALTYLHANDIVHQDIKPNNFLVDSYGNYYLADLGLSVKIRQTIQRYTQAKSNSRSSIPKNTTGATPPCYRAPELYVNANAPKSPIKATDIWSLGASIFEMASGDVPFGDFGGINQMNNPEPPDLPTQFSADVNWIIKKCLAKETWERPKASDLVEWSAQYIKNGAWPVKLSEKPEEQTIVEPIKPSWLKKSMYALLAVLLIGGLAWGVGAYINPPTDKTVKPFKTAQNLDTAAAKPYNNTEKPIVLKPKDTVNTVIKPEKHIVKPPVVIDNPKPVVVSNKRVYNYPSADEPPRNKNISITKIEVDDNTRIHFKLQKSIDDKATTTFSIYGPERSDFCFFITANGNEYRLLNIVPNGNGLSFGSKTEFYFVGTFQKIPENATLINVIEGHDRDNKNQNYWTTKGIHLN